MLTAAELTLLSRLDLAYRRSRSGLYAGERRSPRAARSPEFSDFRPYVPGDDFRQIDWRAYARLERLTLRLYVAEEEACLNVVVDTSESMALGTPPKWPAARRLAAALAFLGLAAMDRVTLGTLGGQFLPPLRGRDGVGRVWQFLEELEPAGDSGPVELGRLRWLRPGMTVVVSDFLAADPEGEAADWSPALAALAGRRQEPVCWQVLAPDEERPSITGDLKLVDPESGRDREITITPAVVADYERSLAALRARLARSAAAAGGRFLASDSAADLEHSMLAGLKAGVLRRG
ncbi:MAG: DUF58 domain-containing protein [Chloroflexota bacterium]